ncbi:MAG TPA: FtsX-like permease family protein [Gammaproteobacteria bacterium]|nr:FtsX-like permease family protein [Gammaproteobacteria bacterium]
MLQLAFSARNLLRHRARTGIAVSAIGFGVIALLLAGGFIQWILFAMRQSAIESELGHIQVVRPGYLANGRADPFRYLLPGQSPELAAIRAMPHVKVVTPRLAFSGLISHGDTTVSFLGQGVDPVREAQLSKEVHISSGENLGKPGAADVLLGEGLAANLGVKPGDKVVMLVTPRGGGINAVEARVRGLFYTASKAYGDTVARLPIHLARQLLRVKGSHRWVILLDRTDNTDALLHRLRQRFPASSSHLQFVPWYQLADFYNKTHALFSRQMRVVWVIIAAIIVLSISNTMVRSVLERTGEIGTLMALGTRRSRILVQFLSEGLLLGLVGGLLGVGLGLALAHIISAVGIPMPPAPGMARGFTGHIRVTGALVGGAFAMAAVTTLVASLYPAWKASRVPVVDALRHNR